MSDKIDKIKELLNLADQSGTIKAEDCFNLFNHKVEYDGLSKVETKPVTLNRESKSIKKLNITTTGMVPKKLNKQF